jgi:hypothetical protein
VRVFMEQHQASKPHSHHPSFITRLDMDPAKDDTTENHQTTSGHQISQPAAN